MDWGIWFGKLWKGALAAGAAALIGYLIMAVKGLEGDAGAPQWLLLLVPLILHGLGLLNNLVKHLGED